MNRDELVAIGAMAIDSHTPDGLCPLCHRDARDVVDAVEPLIRADLLADLRAEVEALHSPLEVPGEHSRWVRRADVLAIIDGRSE